VLKTITLAKKRNSHLLVQEVEHLVAAVVLHEVDTRADVLASNKLQADGVATSGDAISRGVVHTLECAVRSAGLGIGAKRGVPLVPIVAVGVRVGLSSVEPAPVGVENDLGVDRHTAAGLGAFLGRKGGVDLSGEGADLLSEGHDGEGEREEGDTREHFDNVRNWEVGVDPDAPQRRARVYICRASRPKHLGCVSQSEQVRSRCISGHTFQ
jgi:hypothetical protein